jgi:large subunit ribosomal protein L17
MRHLVKGRHLNRKPPHRIAMLRNMAAALVAHEHIETTVAKAKELRPLMERLITIAKRAHARALGTADEKVKGAHLLHARRRLIAKLGGKKLVPLGKEEINVAEKILTGLAVRYKDRPGGYCRIAKLATWRVGDAAPLARIELLPDTGAQPAAAPAPVKK